MALPAASSTWATPRPTPSGPSPPPASPPPGSPPPAPGAGEVQAPVDELRGRLSLDDLTAEGGALQDAVDGLRRLEGIAPTLSAEALSARHLAKRELFPEPVKPAEPLAIAFGPFVDWVDRSTATITWEVDHTMQGQLRWSMPSGQSAMLKTDRLAKRHTVKVTDLVREGEYTYQILSRIFALMQHHH